MNAMPPRLLRLRRQATALLAVMAGVFIIARLLEANQPGWGLLRAFAEAALVGGLADWFAVTALFRHPLGLPIPHTAIIPANQRRLGEGVAEFLLQNFLNRHVLADELRRIDFAALISAALHDDARRGWLAQRVAGIAGRQLSQRRLGALLADALQSQLAMQRHQTWFEHLIGLARQALALHHADMYQKVSEKSPRWMPRQVNDALYLRLMEGLDELLDAMLLPDSAARLQFGQSLREQAARLADGSYDNALAGALASTDDNGSNLLTVHVDATLAALADRLIADPAQQAALNRWLRRQAVVLLVRRRAAFAGLVRRVIDAWDAPTVAARVESRVGTDLQFVRISGTLVGGAVGLLLHIISITF